MRYKGFNIWFNDIQNVWHVQIGYEVVASYKTVGAAKSAITQKWAQDYGY